MTNNQIIFEASQELAEAGIIKYTGRILKGTNDLGEEVEIKETEAIHTYKEWQSLGYQVNKGQKSIARITIWNFTNKPSKAAKAAAEAEGKEATEKARYYMKEACFFSASQVSKIEKKEAPELEKVDSYIIDANYIDNLLAAQA